MPTEDAGTIHAEERERITKLLSRYPNLPSDDLEEVKNWLQRVATALDMGLIASDPRVANQFRQFRADHLDRFTKRDWATAIAIIAAIGLLAIGMATQMT